MEPRHPGDKGRIVRKVPISVNLAEIVEQKADKIVGVRALRMPREQQALPRTKVGVKILFQLGDFATKTFQIGGCGSRGIHKPGEPRHIAFEGRYPYLSFS